MNGLQSRLGWNDFKSVFDIYNAKCFIYKVVRKSYKFIIKVLLIKKSWLFECNSYYKEVDEILDNVR